MEMCSVKNILLIYHYYSPSVKLYCEFYIIFVKLLKYYLFCHRIKQTKSKLKYLQTN